MPEPIIAADNAAPKQNVTPAPVKSAPAPQTTAAKPAAEQQLAAPQQGADGKKEIKTTTEQKDQPKKPAQQQGGSPWLSMLPFILIFVVMIFFMNRSQKKQMQKRQEMMDKIAKGSKVLLTSGIYGVVDAVHDDSMVVEIASGVKVKVAKAGVADVVTDGEKGKTEGK